MSFLGGNFDLDDEDQRRPAPPIGRPGVAGGIPAAALRGLGPVAPPTENANASAAAAPAPAIQSAPIAKPSAPPSPLQTRTSNDQAELQRLQSTGSGISQIHNRVGRGILRGLDTVGSILAPEASVMIPGTELHHNLLEHQQRGRIGEDLGEAQKEVTTAKDVADTGEANARTALTEAQTKAAGEPKPKEEKWEAFAGWTDTDGTPLVREENSGQVVRADTKKPPAGFKAAAPKTDRPDTPEQQYIDEYQRTHKGATIEQAEQEYARIHQAPKDNSGREEGRADRSYQFHTGLISKLATPIEQRAERISRLEDTLNQNSPQADTLVAPELLTVMAGGQGSGLRMNEAEIARVIGGRDKWESIKAQLQAWQADPSKPFAFQPEQRKEIRGLFATIRDRVNKKMQVLDEEQSNLAGATDPAQHRQIYNRVKQRLNEIDAGGGANGQQGGGAGKKWNPVTGKYE